MTKWQKAHKLTWTDLKPEKVKVKKGKSCYGQFRHGRLTDDEHEKLVKALGVHLEEMIRQLDEGIELKGYKYKSHYLAVLKWWEKRQANKKPWED